MPEENGTTHPHLTRRGLKVAVTTIFLISLGVLGLRLRRAIANGNKETVCPPVTRRGLKLAVTASCLVILELLGLFLLLAIATKPLDKPLCLGGLALRRPWVLGALAGLLGGTTRALYAFHVDVRGYEFKKWTRRSYPDSPATASGRAVPDDFDFMRVWYLFLIKPFIGAALGFLFALLQRFGLIPFLSDKGTDVYGIVLVAGLAGIFADQAMDWFRSLFRGSGQPAREDSDDDSSDTMDWFRSLFRGSGRPARECSDDDSLDKRSPAESPPAGGR